MALVKLLADGEHAPLGDVDELAHVEVVPDSRRDLGVALLELITDVSVRTVGFLKYGGRSARTTG